VLNRPTTTCWASFIAWYQAMNEAQHVVVGRFSTASVLQAAVMDRGKPRNEKGAAVLYLFDLDTGRELWRRPQPSGAWGANCQEVRWTGRDGLLDILVAGRGAGCPVVIYDGNGEIVEELEIPSDYCGTYHAGALGGVNTGVHYCYRADLCGDSRDEIMVVGWKGVRIYANARALQLPTHYNTTIYRGM
jgi:outer membrane protein assembly factor BamB